MPKKRKLSEEDLRFQDLVAMLGSLGLLPGPLSSDPRLQRPGSTGPQQEQYPRNWLLTGAEDQHPGARARRSRERVARDRGFRNMEARGEAGYTPDRWKFSRNPNALEDYISEVNRMTRSRER